MMEYMKESKRFLLESEKHRVKKFDVLEIIVDHVVKFQPLRP
jgi:hypothetical protein